MNEPVLICVELDTVPVGNCVDEEIIPAGKPEGYTYDAVVANDAVLGVNVMDVAALAVMALFAQLLVPVNDPTNEPVNEPVLICVELDTTPVGKPDGLT